MPSPERLTTRGLQVVPLETPSLGDRSYLAHDGTVAVVVDPQRDIDRVLALADDEGVRITHVLETHIHNDYVTGGLALARATGASYHVNADDDVAFERTPIRSGDVLQVSASMRVRAIATPGHTFTHLSYALEACADDQAQVVAVFTGGSLLFGTTGRPDLLGDEHAEELARLQHGSARRLAQDLPGDTSVMPTHGFGSFCSSGSSGDSTDASTIARRAGAEPRPDPGRAALGGRDPRGPGRLPRRTTRRWHRPTRPDRTRRTSARPPWPTGRPSPSGSPPAAGSSTCARGPPSPRATRRGR